jgi:hypothetical protein
MRQPRRVLTLPEVWLNVRHLSRRRFFSDRYDALYPNQREGSAALQSTDDPL